MHQYESQTVVHFWDDQSDRSLKTGLAETTNWQRGNSFCRFVVVFLIDIAATGKKSSRAPSRAGRAFRQPIRDSTAGLDAVFAAPCFRRVRHRSTQLLGFLGPCYHLKLKPTAAPQQKYNNGQSKSLLLKTCCRECWVASINTCSANVSKAGYWYVMCCLQERIEARRMCAQLAAVILHHEIQCSKTCPHIRACEQKASLNCQHPFTHHEIQDIQTRQLILNN